MSLPGVECARRRRASHGRSAALEPHVRLGKLAAPTAAGSWEGESSHSRAMAARHRLDEKLGAVHVPCRLRCHTKASSSSNDVALAPTEADIPALSSSMENGLRLRSVQLRKGDNTRAIELKEERVAARQETKGDGEQQQWEEDDCPVCLESLVAGQMAMALPCSHRFHSTCLVPWLLGHHHCPFCRAHVANPHGW